MHGVPRHVHTPTAGGCFENGVHFNGARQYGHSECADIWGDSLHLLPLGPQGALCVDAQRLSDTGLPCWAPHSARTRLGVSRRILSTGPSPPPLPCTCPRGMSPGEGPVQRPTLCPLSNTSQGSPLLSNGPKRASPRTAQRWAPGANSVPVASAPASEAPAPGL